jgi:hypothetical protein
MPDSTVQNIESVVTPTITFTPVPGRPDYIQPAAEGVTNPRAMTPAPAHARPVVIADELATVGTIAPVGAVLPNPVPVTAPPTPHLAFPKESFPAGLIRATKGLIKAIWKEPEVADRAIEAWIQKASELMNINMPTVTVEENRAMYMITGGGCYTPNTHSIKIYKRSLVTCLHEFRHAYQFATTGQCSEVDAFYWSHSLFYCASERLYNNALEKGIMVMNY